MVKTGKSSWKSVALNKFPSSYADSNFDGLIGLEECIDYDLDSFKEKRIKNTKKKRKQGPITLEELPNKKTKLTNGFTVETINYEKPNNTSEKKHKKRTVETDTIVGQSESTSKKLNDDTKTNTKTTESTKTKKKTKKKGNKTKKSSQNEVEENGGEGGDKFSLVEMAAWSAFQIPEEVLRGLAELGFKQPTQIQELTLPAAMLGRRDILGAAETGSGKTLAFGIPIISGIMELKKKRESGQDVYDIQYKKSSIKKNAKPDTLEKKVKLKSKKSQKKMTKAERIKQYTAKNVEPDSDDSGDDLNALLQESDDEGSDSEEQNSDNSDLEEQNSDTEEQNSDINEQDSDMDEQNSDMDEQNSDMDEQNSDMDEQNSDMDEQNSDMDEQNSDMDEQNSDMDEQNFDIDARNSDTDDQNSDTEEQNSDVEEQRKESTKSGDTAEDNSDSENSEDYLHLSDFNLGEDEGSENESKEVDETHEDIDDEVNESEKGIGCVKVLDDIELPEPEHMKTGKPLYALILTPTRELAMQIHNHLIAAAKYTGVHVAVLVGGMAQVKQERVLSRGPEIVVATPGRLWELIQLGNQHLQQVDSIKFLAIDETDRMTERSHFEELRSLLERINHNDTLRGARQNFVFSATLTMVHDLPNHMKNKKVTKHGKILYKKIEKMNPQQKLKKLIALLGMTDPKVVDITSQNQATVRTLTESRITCPIEQKDYYMYYILKRHPGRTIVFCNSIGCVRRLTQLLGLLDCKPWPLHAGMPQRQRLKNLERFRDHPYGVMIATDVAARGLDIPDVDHVIHYQVPRTAENYVHRSGRTARANKEGLAILMMEPGEAHYYVKLCRTLEKSEDIPMFPVPDRYLLSIKELVTAAQELDRLELADRKQNQEVGWLKRAAEEMDIIVDENDMPMKSKGCGLTNHALNNKRKQLKAMMSRPMFPKGFSYKYPTMNNGMPYNVLQSDEKALTVMKTAIETGSGKKEKRTSRNSHLLKLGKEVKGTPVNVTDVNVTPVDVSSVEMTDLSEKDFKDKIVNGQKKNGEIESKSKKRFRRQKKVKSL